MRWQPPLNQAVVLGVLGLGVPAASSDDVWSSVLLPSGYASIDTPCSAGDVKIISRPRSEGVNCAHGRYHVAFIHTDGPSFAGGKFGVKPFAAMRSGLLEDPKAGGLVEGYFSGMRSVRWEGRTSTGYVASFIVEISDDRILLVRVSPKDEEPDLEELRLKLDRAIQSIELAKSGEVL